MIALDPFTSDTEGGLNSHNAFLPGLSIRLFIEEDISAFPLHA
jgi:hypothetical protein